MSRRLLERIRTAIIAGDYDLTCHAVEEMAEDGLGIADVEGSILDGVLAKVQTEDQRGSRYTVVGPATDLVKEVGTVGRFTETDVYLIITVYEVTELEGW